MKTFSTVINNFKTSFMEASTEPDFINCIVIYFILYIMVIILPIYLYYISQGKSPLTSAQYAYVYLFMYIMALLLCVVIFLNTEKNKKLFFGMLIALVSIIGLLVYYYNNSSKFSERYSILFAILFQFVGILIVIVALALTYKIFENNFRNQSGFIGFLIDLIFYLPCLFTNFVQFIGKQLNMTPNIVFLLFIIEILLLMAYYYIPRTIHNAIFTNEIRILPDASFLNGSSQIASSEDLMPIISKNPDTNLDVKTPRQNYTISMWIYLNQQYHNIADQQTANIFSYGSNNDYKPKISYYNVADQANNKNIYRITFAGSENSIDNEKHKNTSYDIELVNQKWNHIVFNYNNAYVDLYINGVLERTFNFNGENPKYYATDIITIGQKLGVDGAICNVSYYTIPLTNYQIVNMYNLLHNQNPPIAT
jgi:Concanavalin A-like lectin/glucanases superfamily